MYDWAVTPSLEFLDTYGLFLVSVICLAEGLLVGKLIPTEVIIPAAVLAAGSGQSGPLFVLTIAVSMSTLGQYLLFTLIRRTGTERIDRSRWVRLSEHHLARSEVYFARWGTASVAGSNALPLIRGWITLPAAVSGLPTRSFILSAFAGNFLYHSSFVAIALLGAAF